MAQISKLEGCARSSSGVVEGTAAAMFVMAIKAVTLEQESAAEAVVTTEQQRYDGS